jgi:K+-sensing histidine kinase KdpD
VETLIEISQLKSGLAPLSPSAFSFATVAEDALKTVQERAAARLLSLEGHIAAALPPTWGDRELIQRVVVHLLTEAVESSAQGDTVAITATVASTHHDKIRVAIKALGPDHGVSEDTVPYGDSLPAARHQIALMFCQATLEAHRERLWVTQTPKEGQAVMFTLPQVTEVLQQAQAVTRL